MSWLYKIMHLNKCIMLSYTFKLKTFSKKNLVIALLKLKPTTKNITALTVWLVCTDISLLGQRGLTIFNTEQSCYSRLDMTGPCPDK